MVDRGGMNKYDTLRAHAESAHPEEMDPEVVVEALDRLAELEGMRSQILALNTGDNRRLYGVDFEAGMVKALYMVNNILGNNVDIERLMG